jgi:hypothetical protein
MVHYTALLMNKIVHKLDFSNSGSLLIYSFQIFYAKNLYKCFLLGIMAHSFNPTCLGGESKRITSLRPGWAKLVRSYLKKKKKKKNQQGWGHSSSDRAHAYDY